MGNQNGDRHLIELVNTLERAVEAAIEIDGLPRDRAIAALELVKVRNCNLLLREPDNPADTPDKV